MPYRYSTTVTGKLTAAQTTLLRTLVDQLWPGQMTDVARVQFRREQSGVHFDVTGKIEVADAAALPAGELVVERV